MQLHDEEDANDVDIVPEQFHFNDALDWAGDEQGDVDQDADGMDEEQQEELAPPRPDDMHARLWNIRGRIHGMCVSCRLL